MISLKLGLPLVRDDLGRSVAFDPNWLKTALTRAAMSAGYQSWWLADDLAVGIASFLRHDYRKTVIDQGRLEQVVRNVLCEVGYQEVAVRFCAPLPHHRISLVRCLREIPQNNRTEFFESVARQIERMHQQRSSHMHFSDLHACVRGLNQLHAETHGEADHGLLQLVVAFVQGYVQSLRWPGELLCSIS